jgi:mannose-6-phosphate isomerase-like protein (cupin superfamily)
MPKDNRQPYHERRPWGAFEKFTQNEPSTVKIITVDPNQATSLQHHGKRQEFWKVLSGEGTLTVGKKRQPAKIGDEIIVPQGVDHRLEAGSTPLIILEISTGDFDENDIVRIDDRYGRVAKKL